MSHRMLLVMVLMVVCQWESTEAVGGAKSRPRPQKKPKPKPKQEIVDVAPPAQNIDLQRMTGKWFLLNAASKCPYLVRQGSRVEPTVMTLTFPSTPNPRNLLVSTKTRHGHQCWEILQNYYLTDTPGRLMLLGSRPELKTDIVIAETDYTSYAIIYYQRQEKLTIKYYSRAPNKVTEERIVGFEQLTDKQGFGLSSLYPFPTYSHCGDVDEDHKINCVPTC